MKRWRILHTYLGCIFAPLIIYFALSGVWQLFRLNDLPKSGDSTLNSILHEASNPHIHSTLPNQDHHTARSIYFNWLAAMMGLGMIATTCLGIFLALRSSQKRAVTFCLVAGLLVPIALLFLV